MNLKVLTHIMLYLKTKKQQQQSDNKANTYYILVHLNSERKELERMTASKS